MSLGILPPGILPTGSASILAGCFFAGASFLLCLLFLPGPEVVISVAVLVGPMDVPKAFGPHQDVGQAADVVREEAKQENPAKKPSCVS